MGLCMLGTHTEGCAEHELILCSNMWAASATPALAPALANQSSVQGKGVGHKDLNKPTLSLLSLTLSHQTPHPMIHACLGPGQVGQDPCPSLLFQL